MPRKTKKVKVRNELPSEKKKKVVSKRQLLQIPKTGMYEGVEFESLLELSFLQWSFFLKSKGYIKNVERPPSFELTENVVNIYTDEKGKKRSQILMRKSSYSPDALLVWKKGWEDFVWDINSGTKMNRPLVGYFNEEGEMVTIIEIKPVHDRNQSIRIVKDRIKMLYEKQGIFVNLVQPELFYQAVFPPDEWLLTGTGRARVLKYVPRTFSQYLKTVR